MQPRLDKRRLTERRLTERRLPDLLRAPACLAFACLLFCFAPQGLLAQTVAVQSTLTDGSGGAVGGRLYLHFTLFNCGANIPINSTTSAIVKRSFDVVANASGVATGTVVPNDLIKCGNVPNTTQWTVSAMSSENSPITQAQNYFICSSSASALTCAQPAAGATFNIANAQPSSVSPPAPGFIPLFVNPVQSQTATQPVGTSLNIDGQTNFAGTVNFCSATVLCGGSGALILETNGTPNLSQTTVNFVAGPNMTLTNTGTQISFASTGAGGGLPNPFVVNSTIPSPAPALPGASTTSLAVNNASDGGHLAQAANGQAFYDDFLTKADILETDAFNWKQSPTSPSALTGGSPATVTITCTRGLDSSFLVVNGDTLGSDYYVDIGGTGTAEAVGVTATTCTNASNGVSGTITFTPVNSHSAGYTVGSAVQGAQEAINWGERNGAVNVIVRLPCTNGVDSQWDAPVETHGNFVTIDGQECARVDINHFQQGIILGDQAYGVGNYFFGGVKGLRMIPNHLFGSTPKVNLVQSITQSGAPGPCTYTATFTANHDFFLHEQVVFGGMLNYNQIAGIRQIASIPAANQVTFTTNGCTALVGQIYAGGWAVHDYVGIEDNLNDDGTLYNVSLSPPSNGQPNSGFSYGAIFISDEHATGIHLNAMNSTGVNRPCTTEWCGAVILAPGNSGPFNANGAAILNLTDASLSGGNGNIIDWLGSGNDLRLVGNTLLQNWPQFAIRATTRRGGFGVLDVGSAHLENGYNTNPFGNIGLAGIISAGFPTTFTGVSSGALFPNYGTNGNAALQWNYYVIPVSSTSDTFCTVSQVNDQRCIAGTNLGTGPAMPAGYALADSGTGGTFTVAWSPVRTATSYVLLRATISTSGVVQIVTPNGTGNYLIASGINPATACSDVLCSFVDSVGLTPSNYAVPAYGQGAYEPYYDFWPCGQFTGPGYDQGGPSQPNQVSATSYFGAGPRSFCTANTQGTNSTTIISDQNTIQIQGSLQTALQPNITGGVVIGQATLLPAKTGQATSDGGNVTNVKGMLNFGMMMTSVTYPFDLETFYDSKFIKTISTVGNRPSNDAADCASGLDQAGGLSLRCATSISFYINSLNDNSSFKLRLTSTGLNIGGSTYTSTAGVPSSNCAVGDIDSNRSASSASTVLYVCYPANTWNAVTVP